MTKNPVAATTQQALDRFKPTRDRMVRNTMVPCPYCDAAPGVRCTSTNGKYVNPCHRERRRIAVRQQDEATS